MAGFTESAFLKKLGNLYSSQQSIQTLSLWLIHHKKHFATIVKVWFRELLKVKESQKLTFMYLANDVIQNSNKKGPEMRKEFASVLPKAFASIAVPECDEHTRKSLERILTIWEQRGVYDAKLIKECRKAFEIPTKEEAPPPKKQKIEPVVDKSSVAGRVKTLIRHHKLSETEVEVDGKKERHTTLSPRTPAQDAPEPEELIKALLDLENSASSDAAVREKIAGLPPEVSEVNLLAKLEDRASAEKLAVQVNEAVDLLTEYNGRLSLEMEDRKKVSSMLHDFIQTQKDLLAHAEQRMEEYTEKLNKVHLVRQEVKAHMQNMPDMSQIPDFIGGLPPLPFADDLFNIH